MSNTYRNNAIHAILGIRCLFFLLGLSIYYLQSVNHSAGLALASVGLLTATSLLHMQTSRKIALAAIPLDFFFGIILLAHTNGIDGPFIGYSISGLLLLKRHAGWSRLYTVSISYLLLLPVVVGLLEQEPLIRYSKEHALYVVFVSAYFIAIVTMQRNARQMNAHIRRLARIYLSAPPSDFQEAVRQTEATLRRILGGREVWICIDDPSSASESVQCWIHTYFANYLRNNPIAGYRGHIQLPSPIGELIPLHVRRLLKQDGTGVGWLLIKASKQELSLLQNAYVQLIRMKFMHHYHAIHHIETIRSYAVAAERDYIAQDIHDGIAQELFFLSVQLFQLKNAVQKDNLEHVLPILSEMETKVKESHQNIRKFIVDLKGEKRRFNLRDAIESMLKRTTANSGIALDFRSNGWVAQERIEIEEALYHFIEESVNNVMKHAEAKRLQVTLEVTSVQWNALVSDDGKGMNWEELELAGKLGIAGMIKRIKALNGTVTVQSQSSQGTTVTAAIPRERSMAYV